MSVCSGCGHTWHGATCEDCEGCDVNVLMIVFGEDDLDDDEYTEACLRGDCDCELAEYVKSHGK